MNQNHCPFEDKISLASRSAQWSDDLLAHLAACPQCEETVFISSYLCESAAASTSEPLPDPGHVWRKAQAAAIAAVLERAFRPILWARHFAFVCSAAALLITVFSLRTRIAAFAGTFAESLMRHRSAGNDPNSSFLLLVTTALVLILPPLLLALYYSWAQD